MNARRIAGCTLAFSLGATLLFANEQWKSKPYTEWTMDDVNSILFHSEWSHSKEVSSSMTDSGMTATKQGGFTTVTPGAVGTNAKGQREANPDTVTVRAPRGAKKVSSNNGRGTIQWKSSLTVRQALERWRVLEGLWPTENANALPSVSPSEYAIAVSGDYLVTMIGSIGTIEETPLQSAYLKSKETNVLVYPSRIAREVLFTTPSVAVFYFPKDSGGHPLIGPADKHAEFHWTLGKNHVDSTFDLRKMMRDSKPDL